MTEEQLCGNGMTTEYRDMYGTTTFRILNGLLFKDDIGQRYNRKLPELFIPNIA